MNLQVIDKIKKLLALSSSSNQHEAELALSHAKRLALLHEIDLIKLRNEPIEESTIEKSKELATINLKENKMKYSLKSLKKLRVVLV